MSGHKRTTVTISQDEYRRLYEAERKNYYDVLAIPDDILTTSLQSSQDALVQDFDRISERQASYEHLLDSFQSQVREVEKATSQSLIDQQTSFYNELLNVSDSLWENTAHLVTRQTDEFFNNVESQHQYLQSELLRVDQQIGWWQDRQAAAQQTAEEWLSDAQQLCEFMAETYPAELCNVQPEATRLRFAEANYHNGIFEACIAAAQDAFVLLSEKRLHCEKVLANRKALSAAAVNRLSLLNQRMVANQNVPGMDLSGQEMEEMVDVDFWTDGAYKKLLKKSARLLEQVRHADVTMSEEALKEVLDQTAPAYTDQFADLVHSARRNALNAQLRFNIAQLLMASAMSQGYQPVSGTYEANDFRNGYCATARSADGSEIAIRVEPNGDFEQDLHVENRPGRYQSESEMKRRLVEVIQSLGPVGFEVGRIVAETPNTAYGSANAPKTVKEAKTTYRLKDV